MKWGQVLHFPQSAAVCKSFAARIQDSRSSVKCAELKGNAIGKGLTFPESVAACKCFAERIQIVSQVRGVEYPTYWTG